MILHCLANTIILVQYNFTSVYVQPSSSLCWLFYQTLYLEVPKSPNLMLRIGYDSFPLLPMIPGSNFMARARLTLVEAFHGIKPTIWMIYIMGRTVGRFFIGISWKMRWLPFFQDTQYIPRFSTDVIGWFDVSWMIQWWTATNHPANRVAPINAGGWFCFPADWWFAQLGKWLP